jgi:protein SCO1/2
MSYNSPVSLFFMLVWLLVLGTLGIQPAYAHGPSDDPLQAVAFEQKLDTQVPLSFTFQDEQGNSAPLSHYIDNRPAVLVFAYYECPNLCSLVLESVVKNLKELSFDIGDEFNVITISIDPSETPAQATTAKNKYIESYGRPGASDGWHFLTGNHEAIDQLTAATGFEYAYDAEQDQYAHAAGLIILTPQGRISRYLYGLDFPSRDLRLGLIDASANKIGTWVDQVLLRCYRYDPVIGRYTPIAMNILRIAGLLTVLVIGGAMVVMLRQERKPTPA